MLGVAELSLTALTCAASYGLVRLFVDASFVPQVLGAGVVAHALAVVCRRRGLSPVVTSAISAIGLVIVIPWLLLGDTTFFGIPTGETWSAARADLSDAWLLFGHVKAPAPVLPGFVMASAIGAWGLAFLADTAAFRAGGLVEAMVPASTLFVFGAALGAPRQRLLCTMLFTIALLAFWLSARAQRQLSSPSFMARRTGRGTQATLRTGAFIGGVGVLAAVVLGPNLPGADARAVIPWRASDRSSGPSRVTVSPLVDIRTRIVDQASVEVFTVKSPVRSYWRLTALETFDGRIWSSERKYRRAEGTLDAGAPAGNLETETVKQEFDVTALESIWLPAAFRPVHISGTKARYDAESGSLLTEETSAIGQHYVVESALPQVDAAQLSTATEPIPDDIARTYLALPTGFPGNVVALAQSVVQGARNPYEMARRLQDFFRSGEFVYDLEVPPGHGDDALERFLFETRRGYCEQYAGAYAAMARAVGLPARVGVGFTTGEQVDDETYSVKGLNGHAWPEVYLAGFGWIAFEPTPGRGIPGGEAYTGVPEAQATPGFPNTATTIATTTTVAAPAAGGSTTIPDLSSLGAGGPGGSEVVEQPNPWPRRALVTAIVFVGVPILWILGVFVGLRLRRWRRRSTARSGGDRVVVAWDEVGEAFARSGLPPRRSETPTEFAGRASRVAKLDPSLLDGLAVMTTVTRYAPPGDVVVDEDAVTSAIAVAKDVRRTVTRRADRRTKLRNLLDPRVPADR